MPALRLPPTTASCLTGLVCVAMLGGCSTTTAPKAPAPARVEVQEEVGFTIMEAGRISNDVRLDYDEALRLLRRGDLRAGIASLEAVVTAAPYLMAPLIDLGIAYHQVGDFAAAERNLLLALKANPDHPIAHNELGIVYRKTGRFFKARQSYEAALAIYPGYHYARRNLAVLCDLYLADLDCALANYEAYMTTVSVDDEAAMWMADARYRAGQSEE